MSNPADCPRSGIVALLIDRLCRRFGDLIADVRRDDDGAYVINLAENDAVDEHTAEIQDIISAVHAEFGADPHWSAYVGSPAGWQRILIGLTDGDQQECEAASAAARNEPFPYQTVFDDEGRVTDDAVAIDDGNVDWEEMKRFRSVIAARRRKRAFATEDLPDWLIERIAASRMDPRHDHLDDPDEKEP